LELNDAKYPKSHAQVQLDRAGVADTLWFLAKDYLAHVHNLNENIGLNLAWI
jgi:hypothetical protein